MPLSPDDTDPTAAELVAARPHLSLHAMDGPVMDDVPLAAVADAVGTPTWAISAGAIRARRDAEGVGVGPGVFLRTVGAADGQGARCIDTTC